MGSVLSDQGITVDLPPGWEGRIMVRQPQTVPRAQQQAPGSPPPPGPPADQPNPVVHLGNFALPADRGDFGSGAVDLMGFGNLLVVLFEYGAESVGTPLFANPRPRNLQPGQFHRDTLQRAIPGQAGFQQFFTESGRAFCLYVVLGAQRNARHLAGLANHTLDATTIAPR